MGLERIIESDCSAGLQAAPVSSFGLASLRPRPPISVAAEQFLDSEHRLLIDGEWRSALDGATFQTFDPATGEALATLSQGGRGDVDHAVLAARAAFDGPWARLLATERGALIDRLGELIAEHQDLFAELETLDNGMTIGSARATVSSRRALFTYYAGMPLRIEGATIPNASYLAATGEMMTYTRREPVGVAALIVPWNVPLALACLKLAPALAAGCTVVLKPAELTPLSAQFLGKLVLDAGIPKGVVNVVHGLGAVVGAALAEHPDVDKISFTGSTQTGRAIVRSAATNLKRVSLELGGKAPVLLFEDADLDLAIPDIIGSAFWGQGQNCMAATRIYVDRRNFARVVAEVVAGAECLVLGHGLDPVTTLGPLISRQHRERVSRFVDAASEAGAELLTGGTCPDGPGHFLTPAVFISTEESMSIMRDEVFGPVLSIQPFDGNDPDTVVRLANDSIYGLAASIWTTSLKRAHHIAGRIRAGQVSVNCHAATGVNIPFGGFKQSGWGREFGQAGLDAFLETKSVSVRL